MDLSLWGNDDPFDEMRRMQRTMFGPGWMMPGAGERRVASHNAWDWQPHCDISETDKDITLHAELPGVKKEDVKVDVKDGVLTVSGETKHQSEEKGNGNDKDSHWHRIERRSGKFMRRLQLPDTADISKIAAHSENGVLTVTVPKTAPPAPRQTSVPIQYK